MTSVDALRARFDAPDALGYGIEEELFLVDHETLDELPLAREVHERTDGDPRFKLELMAAQLEIVTPPSPDVETAVEALRVARRDLATAAEPIGRLMSAGAHPIASELSVLTDDPRYPHTLDDYGERARRQARQRAAPAHLARRRRPHAGGLQRAALAPPGARRAGRQRAVPRGRDTGLASIRPTIAVNLRRQGVPPHDPELGVVRGGARVGPRVGHACRTRGAGGSSCACTRSTGRWRCACRTRRRASPTCTASPRSRSASIRALAARLRRGRGRCPSTTTWRIDENRWSAMRDGVEGTLADLTTGERMPTRELLRSRVAGAAPGDRAAAGQATAPSAPARSGWTAPLAYLRGSVPVGLSEPVVHPQPGLLGRAAR